ncbi:MAG: thiolase family protein [Deltaproteobacteria bacterium]|nr:thiolase family protein [Deltaproteobacteria bacterium]
MKNIYIIGTDTLRYGNYLNTSHIDLTMQTVEACLADAQLFKEAIESVHFGNGLWGYSHGQHGIRGHLAMRGIGIDSVPVTNHEAACATGILALHSAYKDILTGLFECSLAVGVEKVVLEDRKKSLASFGVYIDTTHEKEFFKEWDHWMANHVDLEIPEIPHKERSPFMDLYAYFARWHMARYGTTREHLAIAASKNHWHSTMNAKAQFQFEFSPEKVLNDIPVAWPLTRAMCAPIGDGASSALVCSEDFLERLPYDVRKRAVAIKASVYVSGDDDDLDSRPNTCQKAAEKAYKMAGVSPKDINLAEVHDATIVGEIMQIENMGLCPVGEGGPFTASGATRLGGKIPVNTSGGLVSRGHPVSASGLGMIHELVTQLRGEAGRRQVDKARLALCENGGGILRFKEAAIGLHILEGPGRFV